MKHKFLFSDSWGQKIAHAFWIFVLGYCATFFVPYEYALSHSELNAYWALFSLYFYLCGWGLNSTKLKTSALAWICMPVLSFTGLAMVLIGNVPSRTVRAVQAICLERGKPRACMDAVHMSLKEKDYTSAVTYGQRGCRKGSEAVCYNLACAYCLAGEAKRASEVFQNFWKSLGASIPPLYKELIRTDKDLDCLRQEEWFPRLD